MASEPFVYTRDDVLGMLDRLLASQGSTWWGEFFADRARPCPFFVDWPDENLAQWFGDGTLAPGRVLELGCGHGRNALWLAGRGCHVDAVDFSAQAIDWARERARSAAAAVHFQCCSIFDATFDEASYDLVYDAPRNRGGAASPIYIGTTMEADPTARPITTCAASRITKAGADAAARTPAINSAAVISIVGWRPIRSAIRPAPIAPIAAPARRKLVTSSFCTEDMFGKSFLRKRSAPDTTPVS